MTRSVLVIGGTGILGEPVARTMQAAGYRVRIMSRHPDQVRSRFGDGFEAVQGDVEDPKSLEVALRGCRNVHISLSATQDEDLERRGVVSLIKAAAAAGTQRIGYVSGISVCEQNCWFPLVKAKHAAESALKASGISHTIFKPTWVMEVLPNFVHGRLAFAFGKEPPSLHWLAAEDFARMVARAFDSPKTIGKSFLMRGPEALSVPDALSRYCSIAHPKARVVKLSFRMASIMASVGRREKLKAVLPFLEYFEHATEGGDASAVGAEELLGPATTTLQAWSQAVKSGGSRPHAGP